MLTRRPATIKAEIGVSLPRPRSAELLMPPELTALKRQALQLLLTETAARG